MKRHLILRAVVLVLIALTSYGLFMIRRGFSAKEEPSGVEKVLARTMRNMAIPAVAKNEKNPLPASNSNIQEGLEHFADHCATCHANDGSGHSDIGENLYPKPPDMRSAETQNLSDGEIYYTIANGVRLSGMPASDHSTEDNWRLVLFIRHLRNLTAAERTEMEQLSSSHENRHEDHEKDDGRDEGSTTPDHHHL